MAFHFKKNLDRKNNDEWAEKSQFILLYLKQFSLQQYNSNVIRIYMFGQNSGCKKLEIHPNLSLSDGV